DEINDALDGLEYTSNPGYCHAPDTLTITTDDGGNTGAGGAKVDGDVLGINADANNAPNANGEYYILNVLDTDPISSNVRDNDSDPDGDPIRISAITNSDGDSETIGGTAATIDGAYGTLTIDENGTYSYS